MKNTGSSVKKILVVEDELGISQVCLRVLSIEGFEVDIAVNGEVAQEILIRKEYDLCLIDIRTPVMNGKQLYQVIITKHPDLVKGVIFTTGDILDGYTQRFLELANRPFLPKPFDPDELRAIVWETVENLER
jgi:DNA-binding response OmpR family regulator